MKYSRWTVVIKARKNRSKTSYFDSGRFFRFSTVYFCVLPGNIGSGIDHTTTRGENVADLIEDTLQILERYGGPDAFINIKYMVPTYESCVLN